MLKIIKDENRILVSDSLKEKLLKILKFNNIFAAHFEESISFYKDGLMHVLLLRDDEELEREVIALDGICFRIKSVDCLKTILCLN